MEYKFRGKRIDTKEFVYGFYGECDDQKFIVQYEKDFGICGSRTWNVLPETVGQYTGLTDRNGKEVYEGDILRHMGSPSYTDIYIVWDEYTASFGWLSVEWVRTQGKVRKIESLGLDYYEVVGNIHTEVGK